MTEELDYSLLPTRMANRLLGQVLDRFYINETGGLSAMHKRNPLVVFAVLIAAGGTPATLLAEDTAQEVNEVSRALNLTPDRENGRAIYNICSVCHLPEGWGTANGAYPQIAGQLRGVIVKQLADIRARNRDNPIMFPFAMPGTLGGAQGIADVAEYIASLPMTPNNTKGPGVDLEHGQRLYQENCVDCHGEQGEGGVEEHIPLLYGQHYPYLIRQFEWIQSGRRRNADSKMVKQVQRFTPRDIAAVMDYVSRLPVPPEKLAQAGWFNPDFPRFVRPAGSAR